MNKVRTRFAPSPTGYMHIGNLRTALYEYLIAKSQGGDFILRIEDTDRSRYVEGAEEVIYNTLKAVGLKHDEGPDIGGNYGPYIQSERKGGYLAYAKKLVESGDAYYCFCEKSESDEGHLESGHKDVCRNLSKSEIQANLKAGKPYVIRQKTPENGTVKFDDLVFGEVKIDSKEIEDQILIKSDGYPTYNFANVIDDHEMHITHVVRGCEYLSSTPKYNLLYEAFGWEKPIYIHLPLIMGQNEDGSVSKLSKRHGAVSFEDLVKMGYLPEAIINYIAFLGWCPESNREIFNLQELEHEFSPERISKSPAVFDYKKLDWFNAEYIKSKSAEEFLKLAEPYIKSALVDVELSTAKISELLRSRISKLGEIPDLIDFFGKLPDYDTELFVNKKSKTNKENSVDVLQKIKTELAELKSWDYNSIHDLLIEYAKKNELKNGTVMWPVRIAVSGKAMTPGGAIEILDILGREEALNRIDKAINLLKGEN
ncbi:MAG: glutamate--tRNA ligase [Clostridia bacterium]|nr:glutamate--tRNA ligase [Clostridia bacterium]